MFKKKETIEIAKQMFNTLHEIPEIDQFLEKGRKYFKQKYSIDYFSVHMLHSKKSNFVGYYDHDEWHDYVYTNGRGANHKDDFFMKILPHIKKNEIYFEYLDSYMKDKECNIRAEIIGTRKHGGACIIVSDELMNITIFDITFNDDSSFGNLNKQVLNNLVKDLIRYKPLLLPFADHADKFGDFSDKYTLHQSMHRFINDHASLFNI